MMVCIDLSKTGKIMKLIDRVPFLNLPPIWQFDRSTNKFHLNEFEEEVEDMWSLDLNIMKY